MAKNGAHDIPPPLELECLKALWTLGDPDGKAALLSVISGETKTSSGFFTKQKRDALRMMHTPKPMFMFAVKAGVGFAPVPGLGQGISSMLLVPTPRVRHLALQALRSAEDGFG